MRTEEESICCAEMPKIQTKLNELENVPECVTTHPGFEGVALNRWVLQAAYLTFAKNFDDVAGEQLYK